MSNSSRKSQSFQWTNTSVLEFANGDDPVEAIESKARELALRAMDDGWNGPPFDPLALAKWCDIPVSARDDIPDARTVPVAGGGFVLEFNPLRPRGRLRFSIAHEIAHSLFPDCAKEVRNRVSKARVSADEWQLEVLCNIGAAELLMPLGSFLDLPESNLSIQSVLEIRRKYDVSVEACLIRLVKLAVKPCAAFCASAHGEQGYRLDYVIPTPGWKCPLRVGQSIPKKSVIKEVNAIGFTAVGNEEWIGGHRMRVECVGLAPYPGELVPRVVGLLFEFGSEDYQKPAVDEVIGDALKPRGEGRRLIAHVVPDTATVWGGGGFASKVRRTFPDVWTRYRQDTVTSGKTPRLGEVYFGKINKDVQVAHMVAQRGIGPSTSSRLRYAALAECLAQVRKQAESVAATVHLPRIGTGFGGGNWDVVKEIIVQELADKGIRTTIYKLPA